MAERQRSEAYTGETVRLDGAKIEEIKDKRAREADEAHTIIGKLNSVGVKVAYALENTFDKIMRRGGF
jgi:hypothetical protein